MSIVVECDNDGCNKDFLFRCDLEVTTGKIADSMQRYTDEQLKARRPRYMVLSSAFREEVLTQLVRHIHGAPAMAADTSLSKPRSSHGIGKAWTPDALLENPDDGS